MSVRKRGSSYEVRWTENGRKRSRAFARKGDADAYDLDLKRRRQLGPLAPAVIDSRVTLAEFMETEWWPRYAMRQLAPDTRRRYLEIWGGLLLDRVGDTPIRDITDIVVEDLIGELQAAGQSADAQRRALTLLQAILKRARRRGLIADNPVSLVDKPRLPPRAAPQPLAPATVERIRAVLRPRGAMIVSLLAYAGLRPVEDRAGRWQDVRRDSLHVYATKTKRARDVDLLAPLAQDLREWRLASPYPTGPGDLIVPTATGGAWTRDTWANWRSRVWQPACHAAGIGQLTVTHMVGDDGKRRRRQHYEGPTPYVLRSSFVSLLLWAGEDLPYVAEQCGHSVATLAKHYSGVLRELRGQPKVPAADAIRAARENHATERRTG